MDHEIDLSVPTKPVEIAAGIEVAKMNKLDLSKNIPNILEGVDGVSVPSINGIEDTQTQSTIDDHDGSECEIADKDAGVKAELHDVEFQDPEQDIHYQRSGFMTDEGSAFGGVAKHFGWEHLLDKKTLF